MYVMLQLSMRLLCSAYFKLRDADDVLPANIGRIISQKKSFRVITFPVFCCAKEQVEVISIVAEEYDGTLELGLHGSDALVKSPYSLLCLKQVFQTAQIFNAFSRFCVEMDAALRVIYACFSSKNGFVQINGGDCRLKFMHIIELA